MRIGIVGGGAMGTAFAYLLARTGHEVAVAEGSRERAARLARGVDVTVAGLSETARFETADGAAALGARDAILVQVKAYDMEAVARELASLPGRFVAVSLANGIGVADALAAALGADRAIAGATSAGATRAADGSVALAGFGKTRLAGWSPASSRAAEDVAAVLADAGLPTEVAGDPRIVQWEKGLVNAGINPAGALSGARNGRIAEDEELAALCASVILEGATIARAAGIVLDGDALVERALATCRDTADNECSMLQDLGAGRRTEVDWLNGRIARVASELGLDAPLSRALAALVKAAEETRLGGGARGTA